MPEPLLLVKEMQSALPKEDLETILSQGLSLWTSATAKTC